MIIYVLIAAAVVTLFWPTKKKPSAAPTLDFSKYDGLAESVRVKLKAPAYIQSVAALQTVQKRLAHTEHLDEEQQEAINVLALALTAGSDQL
jgi:hypothetical protein